jgi:hypothetical protein
LQSSLSPQRNEGNKDKDINVNILELFRQNITKRFGDDPFNSAAVQHRLSVDYWNQKVLRKKKEAMMVQ